MDASGLNDNKITVDLGLSVGTIGKSRKEGRDLSAKVIEKILNFYTDINSAWFLTGEGEMLLSDRIIPRSAGEPQLGIQADMKKFMDFHMEQIQKKDAEIKKLNTQIEKLTKERDDAIRQLREQGKQSIKTGVIPSEESRRH